MENKQNKKIVSANPFPKMEEEVLNFWEKEKIFEKSVEREAPRGDYVFYDGPPFGTGEPHYGHILSSVSKDVVPRYRTMRGYRVERKWGWDCHGLPIENIIEADMKISGKKDIEEKVGVAKFNEACRSRVLEYADIWGKMVRRIGRWVDFENSYKTMDLDFMESVWWGFKEVWNKGLIYEGRKVLLYCPRCETPISNFEVAMDNSYKDVTDTSAYVKFKVKNAKEKLGVDGDVYFLAWTTTPWTLPGNVALAVGESVDYVIVEIRNQESGIGENYILAKERLTDVMEDKKYKVVKELKGKNLVDLKYEPLFNIPAIQESGQKEYYVVAGNFVTTEDGAGIVHIAPVYGEEDYKVGLKYKLPIVPSLDEKGHFNETAPEFIKGKYFKKANNLIIENLRERKILFDEKAITHSYPHCHRCETVLFYNAIPAWFINIDKIRKRMLELNEKINWYPEHLKHGRFALGIEQAPDWNISRNRYFSTPMPIWKCEKCGEMEVVGSVDELKKKSGQNEIKDIHYHFIDNITWRCSKCDGKMRRIKEVFDCWVESGSMPFAQMHYPFENKEKFEKNFPAQFISEYISQTRAWFYVTHVISTALFDSNGFENVATTGVILNEKGEKMSKSRKNFPDPWKVLDEYGADTLRFYLMSSSVMHAENLFFNENELKDLFRKNIMILWNVYKFYEMFADKSVGAIHELPLHSENVLDQWILAKLNLLIGETTKQMDAYDLPRATRPITEFINDLSTWYIRRSRDRFKVGAIHELPPRKDDRDVVIATTRYVLIELTKIMAPFTPFIAETIWQKVTGNNFADKNKSVHLEGWPIHAKNSARAVKILDDMNMVRKIVELGLAKRDEVGIKVRQPLVSLKIKNQKLKIKNDLLELIKDEINIKEIKQETGEGNLEVELDTKITEELKFEGIKRELARFINSMRKEAGMTINDRAEIFYETDSELIRKAIEVYVEDIMRDTLSETVKFGTGGEFKKEIKIEGEGVKLGISKK